VDPYINIWHSQINIFCVYFSVTLL
jgi:hypothetical protein